MVQSPGKWERVAAQSGCGLVDDSDGEGAANGSTHSCFLSLPCSLWVSLRLGDFYDITWKKEKQKMTTKQDAD